jgi:tetratricopeptide (TPR) repeat protein
VNGFIDTLLLHFTAGGTKLLTLRPEQAAEGADDPTAVGWRAWALADALHRAGQWERAKLWINGAISALGKAVPAGQHRQRRLLKAEVFATAGQLLYGQGDLGDAIHPLVEADARWVELCDVVAGPPDSPAWRELAEELRGLAFAVDPEHTVIPLKGLVQDDWLVRTWRHERLVGRRTDVAADLASVLSAAHLPDEARDVSRRARRWLVQHYVQRPSYDPERIKRLLEYVDNPEQWRELLPDLDEPVRPYVDGQARVPLARLAMIEGNLQVEAGDVEGSIETFGDAIELLREQGGDATELSAQARLLFNQGNSYLRLERYQDARSSYRQSDAMFEAVGDWASRDRVWQAELIASSRSDRQADLLDEARRSVVEAEGTIADRPDVKNRFVDKAPIEPGYQLLLGQLARRGTVADADDYLRLIRALREPEALADLPDQPVEASDLAGRVTSPLHVLDAHLRHLPGTSVLVLQSAAQVLTYLALRAGDGPLEERLLFGALDAGTPPLLERLLRLHLAELDAMLTGRLAARSAPAPELVETCAAAWRQLPGPLRACLLASSVILYAPDPFASIDEIPIELLRTEQGWLGTTRVIARQLTFRTLMELLSPNRAPSLLSNRAYLVRAEDPPGFDPLPRADAEMDRVERSMRLLGLDPERAGALTTERVQRALDAGFRVFHYAGHGIANTLSEGLPLAGSQLVQPRQFSMLDGYRTPFTYLSACEAGRSRYVAGGRPTGIAGRLLEKGAPAVVGCLQAVPDEVAERMSAAFYRAAKEAPAGEALRLARLKLEDEGYNPACWGLFTHHGDPHVTLSPTTEPRQTRLLTASWSTHLNRWVAARRPQDRTACLAGLQDAQAGASPPLERDLRAAAALVEQSFQPAAGAHGPAQEALCERIGRADLIGGAALRLLLAMEALQGPSAPSDRRRAARELRLGLAWSQGLHDGLAWAAFALPFATQELVAAPLKTTLLMLKEATGILESWAHLAPEYASIHDAAKTALDGLQGTLVVDAEDFGTAPY